MPFAANTIDRVIVLWVCALTKYEGEENMQDVFNGVVKNNHWTS